MIFGGQMDAFDHHKVGFDWSILRGFLLAAGFSSVQRVDQIDKVSCRARAPPAGRRPPWEGSAERLLLCAGSLDTGRVPAHVPVLRSDAAAAEGVLKPLPNPTQALADALACLPSSSLAYACARVWPCAHFAHERRH